MPPLSGPVVDTAQLFEPAATMRMSQGLEQLRKAGGAQIAVLTVASLQGFAIEDFSIRVTDVWKLGDAKKDDGILILIARDERKVRIEVGQGWEGDLPDAYAKRIIDQLMVPAFRQGDYAGGAFAAIEEILRRIHTDKNYQEFFGPNQRRISKRQVSGPASIFELFFIFIMLAVLMAFSALRRIPSSGLGRGRHWGGGSGWSGGGGFRGGGGFSGGGGGFSGGGASGGW